MKSMKPCCERKQSTNFRIPVAGIFGIILVSFLLTAGSVGAQETQPAQAINAYSLALYKQLSVHHENLFFSPLSTYLALTVAGEGARSSTKEAFENVLHRPLAGEDSSFRDFLSGMLQENDAANRLDIANSVWVGKSFPVNPGYEKRISRDYRTQLFPVDFRQSQQAASLINNWVWEHTNGLIKAMVSPYDLNASTGLVIANAIYFYGTWARKFDRHQTKPDRFYPMTGNPVLTDFMNQEEYLNYFENNDLQFVAIPYKGNQMWFCIALPKRDSIVALEKKLNTGFMDMLFNNLKSREVILSFPKFKFETSYSLVPSLENMGLNGAFTPDADFSGISKRKPLYISQVKHMAYIDVDEEKTEAAAATTLMMVSTAVRSIEEPVRFKADHPFIFMIVDPYSRAILFMGKYGRPEKED